MLESLPKEAEGSQMQTLGDRVQWWLRRAALAAAVGIAYYIAGRLGVGLILKPEGVAVFWPAAGISSGVLIALGNRARWPVALGVLAATVIVHVAIVDPLWAGVALGVCNAAEALITAGLITAYFGSDSVWIAWIERLASSWRQSSAPPFPGSAEL